jgi:cytochrome b subunit of formate dehydrogenase
LKFNELLKRIDRIVVWGLLILFLIFMISGYMITKGFIDRYYGLLLHTRLDLPIMMLFVMHVAINVKFMLIRRGAKDNVKLNLLSLTIGTALFLFVLYLDQFFQL